MNKWKGIVLGSAVLLSAMFGINNVQAASLDRVQQGICVDHVDVSGMDEMAVREAVERVIAERQQDEVTLHMNGNTYITTAQALGYTWTNESVVKDALSYAKGGNVVTRYKQKTDLKKSSVSLEVIGTVDPEAVRAVLEENCVQFNQNAVDHTVKVVDGQIQQVPGTIGVALDIEGSVEEIIKYMTEEWRGGDADVDLMVTTEEPGGDAEMLGKIKDKMGAGSTDYSSSSDNRKTNVENAVSKIDGTILYPGDSFSVLNAVLPFEVENGYAAAASYAQGEVVESIGGGVCQVSTTLYLALIRAELQIDARSNHSMMVSYVKPAFDAAVAEGSKDLVFTNNTEAPIYIRGVADGETVSFYVYGMDNRGTDREVEFKSVTVDDNDPKVKVHAELWKYITENGSTKKERVNTSIYYKSNSETDSEAARVVIEMIDALGTIDLSDEGAVAAAESAYNALTSAQQGKVSNISELRDARAIIEQEKAMQATEQATVPENGTNG